MKEHREFIYEHYVSAGDTVWSPANLNEIMQRGPYLNMVIRRYFPQDHSINILDLGCGYGAFVHFIHKAGYQHVVGVDISEEQILVAQELGISGVSHGNLLDTLKGLPDLSQDLIIAFDVIEHFTKDELVSFAYEVYRVLREEGKWILHTPNGEALFSGRSYFWDFTHQTSFTRNSISQFLKSAGFFQVDCYQDSIVVHGLKSALRWLIWEVARFVLRIILTAETGNWDNYILTQNFLTIGIKKQETI